MLQIQNIRKQYKTGDLIQTALDGVSLNLRQHEFVAILGPSGSGKTTLLNVIGGLDRYDSGDLIIDGVSTKKYSDRDWDSYRNHTVGFVFQSYNLIPHQTVLANVELALTISGIPRSERRRRAVKALEEVGLGNQLHKKPNQMSGGQMQRVAIARALVNDPSVLLADEPTGALDSETSIQVMELLKKVAEDRLVVMVTHNPELAMEYASRIVRVKDGEILDDSDPYAVDTDQQAPPVHRNLGRASMSFRSALSLSFNNLRTKKARTLLTAFAGSIGIIGIALILSLSAGFQHYVDEIQADTLANYPLTIQSDTADMSAGMAMMGMGGGSAGTQSPGTVQESPMLSKMFANMGSNDLGAFRAYLESHWEEIGPTLNAVQYGYGVSPRIFRNDPEQILQVNPETLFTKLTGSAAMSAYMQMDAFQEMLDNPQLLEAQYQILEGRWPQSYNELVFVLPDSGRLPDFVAYILGMKPLDGVDKMIQDVINGVEVDLAGTQMEWSYADLMELEFRLVNAPELYRYNEDYGVWEDMSQDEAYMQELISKGELLKVVGVICPREGVTSTSMRAGIGFLPSLTQYVMDQARDTEIVRQQLEHPERDVFSGKAFDVKEETQELRFEDMIHVDKDAISSSFGMSVSPEELETILKTYLQNAMGSITVDASAATRDYLGLLQELSTELLQSYVDTHGDESGKARISLEDAPKIAEDFLAGEGAGDRMAALADQYGVSREIFQDATKQLLTGFLTGLVAQKISVVPSLPEIPTPSLPEVPQTPPLSDPVLEDPEELPTEPTLPQLPEELPTLPELPEELPTLPILPDELPTLPTLPELPDPPELPGLSELLYGELSTADIEPAVTAFTGHPITGGVAAVIGQKMMQPQMMNQLAGKLAGLGNLLSQTLRNSFYVNEAQLAGAFQFNFNEQELRRLMEALSGQAQQRTAQINLRNLGYADPDQPTTMSIYMVDFEAKEQFMEFLDGYNAEMLAAGREEQEIHYMDLTGMMMDSVKTIIDSVSYVLIAFVAVSLVVSSIMIGIITYISVMERTKEIGVLRAMGASRHNISQVFNAETYIIGLCSGLMGIGITLLSLIPINRIIWNLTGQTSIVARLPLNGGILLVLLSMLLTVLGGLIPSRQAAKKDPVIALRSE